MDPDDRSDRDESRSRRWRFFLPFPLERDSDNESMIKTDESDLLLSLLLAAPWDLDRDPDDPFSREETLISKSDSEASSGELSIFLRSLANDPLSSPLALDLESLSA